MFAPNFALLPGATGRIQTRLNDFQEKIESD